MKLQTLFVATALLAASTGALSTSAMAQTADTAAAPAAAPSAPVTPSGDIVATLQASGQFTTLLKALDATNLTAVLKGAGPLTLFAPTDAAFAAMPPGDLDKLMADKAGLQQLLVYHIVNAKVDSSKIVGAKGPIPSAAGKPIYVDGSASPVKADGATITQTNVIVSNGFIYPVTQVLSPSFTPPVASADSASAPDTKAASNSTTRKKQ